MKFSADEPLTDAEEAEIQEMIASEPDNPEVTDEQLAQARPFPDVFPEMMERAQARKSSTPASTAGMYALALKRRFEGTLTPTEAHEPINARNAPAGPQTATGWRKIILPWNAPLTIEDLCEDLCIGLIAAGSPRGAAVYAGEETDQGMTVILSPGAAAIFETMKIMRTAVDCDPPGKGEAELLCGDEGPQRAK